MVNEKYVTFSYIRDNLNIKRKYKNIIKTKIKIINTVLVFGSQTFIKDTITVRFRSKPTIRYVNTNNIF